jgi:hypothetical protein
MPTSETSPLPSVDPRAYRYLRGLAHAHAEGRGKMPPPWAIADRFVDPNDGAVIASVIAALPVEGELWLIRGVLRRAEQGPLKFSRLAIEHFDQPDAEVTGRLLHLIPVATIRERALAWLRAKDPTFSVLAEGGYKFSAADRRWARRVTAEASKQPLKRGRKGYPSEHYRRIALRAVELFESGRRDVVKALEEEECRPYQTIRDWIRRARQPELGFLEPSKQGQTNFRPGPNLYRKEKEDG